MKLLSIIVLLVASSLASVSQLQGDSIIVCDPNTNDTQYYRASCFITRWTVGDYGRSKKVQPSSDVTPAEKACKAIGSTYCESFSCFFKSEVTAEDDVRNKWNAVCFPYWAELIPQFQSWPTAAQATGPIFKEDIEFPEGSA
ncbi:hypothetical protein N7467_001160 [Penicillium canescens]|nr:hypothetical protein N7467_001160 [Penicillium canescens]